MHLYSVSQGWCDEPHTARGAELTRLHRSHSCCDCSHPPQDMRCSPWPSCPAAPASLRSPCCQQNSQCKHMPQDSHPRLPRHQLPYEGKEAQSPKSWGTASGGKDPCDLTPQSLHLALTASQLRQNSPAQYTETRKGQSTSPRGTGTLTPDLRARVTATLHTCKTESSGPTRWNGYVALETCYISKEINVGKRWTVFSLIREKSLHFPHVNSEETCCPVVFPHSKSMWINGALCVHVQVEILEMHLHRWPTPSPKELLV